MKSIMQEASSVTKAIEMGWEKAGKPKEFSVKIFEEPQKNFFGITTRSAKIGIFFEEEKNKKIEATRHKQIFQPKHSTEQNIEKPEEPIKQEQVKQQQAVCEKKIADNKQKKSLGASPWTKEMTESVDTWLKDTLKIINYDMHSYNLEANNFCLLIKFDKTIFEEPVRQRQFFSSLSNLFLQMLKRKYKRPLKGYKIIIQS